jgi:hypothetical protein
MNKSHEGFTIEVSTGGCPISKLSLNVPHETREAVIKASFAKVLKRDCAACLGLVKKEIEGEHFH